MLRCESGNQAVSGGLSLDVKVGTKRCLEGLCLDVSESGNQAVSGGSMLRCE